MSQLFNGKRQVVPVTLIEAGPCLVVGERTKERDGYSAVQIGFEEMKDRKINKPQKGFFKKAGLKKGYRYIKEIKDNQLKAGDEINVSQFNKGDIVKVSGLSKAKGFQGVVKRHGFAGFPATHGTKHGERAPGSIGSAFPERVFKGKKMAGRMGGERVTTCGLEVADIDKENNLLAIKGAVPGRKGTLLEIELIKEAEIIPEEKDIEGETVSVEAGAPSEEEKKGEKKEEKPETEKKEEVGKEGAVSGKKTEPDKKEESKEESKA